MTSPTTPEQPQTEAERMADQLDAIVSAFKMPGRLHTESEAAAMIRALAAELAQARAELEGLKAQQWLPIESAPEGMTECVVVRWKDSEGNECRDLDYMEDGCWMHWHDRAEHVEIIGGHGVSYTAPYEHWTPSRLHPQGMCEMRIHCCACGFDVDARLTTGREVYPHRSDLWDLPFWRCPVCSNFVGCHHKTADRTRPLGHIPTPEIKNARKHIHALLDPIWQSGAMKRNALYRAISDEVGWKYHTAKIRSIEEARKVYRIVQKYAHKDHP